jgi:hypothetical protein
MDEINRFRRDRNERRGLAEEEFRNKREGSKPVKDYQAFLKKYMEETGEAGIKYVAGEEESWVYNEQAVIINERRKDEAIMKPLDENKAETKKAQIVNAQNDPQLKKDAVDKLKGFIQKIDEELNAFRDDQRLNKDSADIKNAIEDYRLKDAEDRIKRLEAELANKPAGDPLADKLKKEVLKHKDNIENARTLEDFHQGAIRKLQISKAQDITRRFAIIVKKPDVIKSLQEKENKARKIKDTIENLAESYLKGSYEILERQFADETDDPKLVERLRKELEELLKDFRYKKAGYAVTKADISTGYVEATFEYELAYVVNGAVSNQTEEGKMAVKFWLTEQRDGKWLIKKYE